MEGIKTLADTVKITMGPRGRNVLLERAFGAPIVTNDGVTIAREVFLSDRYQNMGAQLIKDVASRTNDVAGDGTTASTVLAEAIITEGDKLIRQEKLNPVLLKQGIEKAVKTVVAELDKMKQNIETNEQMKQVATISCQDEEVGQVIADLYEEAGPDGIVQVEEGHIPGIHTETVDGLQIDSGLLSPHMVTDIERLEADLKDVHILVCNKAINDIREIIPILDKLMKSGVSQLVIIADEFAPNVTATLLKNIQTGAFRGICIKSPLFGAKRSEIMEDIAISTGARIINNESGLSLESLEITDLGKAKKIVSDRNKTVIIDGNFDKELMNGRIAQIRAQISQEKMAFDRERHEQRLARLTGGIAVIKVCSSTEVETKDLKYRIEDALNATKAAIAEGVVPGGGAAIFKGSFALDKRNSSWPKEYELAYDIVEKACTYPILQIAKNAGFGIDGMIDKFKEEWNINDGLGLDANSPIDGSYPVKNMFEAGIIDPKMVIRSSLENAASAAAMFLTTEAAIAEEDKEENNDKKN